MYIGRTIRIFITVFLMIIMLSMVTCQFTEGGYSFADTSAEWGEWSTWGDSQYIGSDDREVETRIVYRYRDKSYVWNGNDNLSGYTKESTEYYNFSSSKWQSGTYTKYGNFVMTKPSASTNVTSNYKDVNSYTSVNAQWSYAYVTDKKDWFWKNTGGTSSSGQKTTNLLNVYSSKSLSAAGYTRDTGDNSYSVPKTISTSNPDKFGTIYRIDYGSTDRADTFTSGASRTVLWVNSTSTRTLYKATTVRSRNKFWKWGNWSDWSEIQAYSSSTRAVETKTQYRYRERVEHDSGYPETDSSGNESNTNAPEPIAPTYSTPISSNMRTSLFSVSLTKITKGKKSFTAKWKKASKKQQKKFSGYQIQYSTKADFSSGVKTKSTTKKSASKVTIRKLKKKTTYYVRMRRFKKSKSGMEYSDWSNVKVVKIK